MRDLRVYSEALGGEVYHYRDKNGLECDAVVVLRDESYGLIEIKLGCDEATLAEAAKKLTELENLIDTEKMRAPSFRMILCGNAPYAYRREDGTFVVPLGCLGV